jgi:DnaJ-class molecular chaperone
MTVDYYGILNLPKTASPRDVEKAYLLSIAAYGSGSIATYGLIAETEKIKHLAMIEEAFEILSNAEKRRLYDLQTQGQDQPPKPALPLRKTFQRLEIGDAEDSLTFRQKIKKYFFRWGETAEPAAETEESRSSETHPNLCRGEYLRGVRMSRGISLEEMAAASRMTVGLLKALEENDAGRIPKGTNIRILLRDYARSLGLRYVSQPDED